jgi:uncharacterized cupin superfamily protein
MRRFNLFAAEPQYDATDPDGYRAGMARFGPSIGATKLGGSVYELPPGQSVCPYHYEHGDEEWLIVLSGRPSVRHPDGEEVLEPGDVVCFPAGADGAHKVTNASETGEPVRVLMLSTMNLPAVAVYPDSGKVGVFTAGKADDALFRRADAVEYYDGEA